MIYINLEPAQLNRSKRLQDKVEEEEEEEKKKKIMTMMMMMMVVMVMVVMVVMVMTTTMLMMMVMMMMMMTRRRRRWRTKRRKGKRRKKTNSQDCKSLGKVRDFCPGHTGPQWWWSVTLRQGWQPLTTVTVAKPSDDLSRYHPR